METYTSFLPLFTKVLNNHKVGKYLEWGAGFNSTKLIIDLIGKENVYSIEHDEEWFDKIKDIGCNIYRKDMVRKEICEYVTFPRTLNIKFDFIFIDGRNRVLCANVAKELLNTNGIIMMHDIHRSKYLDGVGDTFNHKYVSLEHDTALFSNDNRMEYLC